MGKQLINGKCYDWSSVTINMPGLDYLEPTKIEYDGERETEVMYGKGGKERGFGTGNLKHSAKIEMAEEDFDEYCRVAKSKGYNSLYGFVMDKVTVSYADEGALIQTDVINGLVLNKWGKSASQGDKSFNVSLEFSVIGGITLGDIEA